MHQFVHDGMVLLETLFVVGWAGSLIVVLISGIEDFTTVLQKDTGGPSVAISGDHDV